MATSAALLLSACGGDKASSVLSRAQADDVAGALVSVIAPGDAHEATAAVDTLIRVCRDSPGARLGSKGGESADAKAFADRTMTQTLRDSAADLRADYPALAAKLTTESRAGCK